MPIKSMTMQDDTNGPVVDLTNLVRLEFTPTQHQARESLVAEVMASHRQVAKAFSAIDGPFAGEDSVHEHGRLEHEFEHLVGRVVHLPESVEGVRLLEQWFEVKTKALTDIGAGATAGVAIQMQETGGAKSAPIILNADMAKGLRLGMHIARQVLGKFPLSMTRDDQT